MKRKGLRELSLNTGESENHLSCVSQGPEYLTLNTAATGARVYVPPGNADGFRGCHNSSALPIDVACFKEDLKSVRLFASCAKYSGSTS